jgi:hypothetical protein
MKSGRFDRTMSVIPLLLAIILAVAALPMAAAQTPGTPMGETPPTRIQDREDDNYGAWGLVGLIGLLGLVGLMRRDRTYPTNQTVDRPTERLTRS